ncbi:MAG: superoxide dismutase family protein [Gemmatimonadota bacterium]
MRRRLLWVVTPLLAAGCASAGEPSSRRTASAELRDTSGNTVGTVRLAEVAEGVRVIAETRDMPVGAHGFHVHAVGACEPTFEAAGDHLNPTGKQHGMLNPEGPHAGDLPNLTVTSDGRGRMEETTDRVTLAEGEGALLDDDGSAIVVHAEPDDQTTDPSGGSGDRIACGVVRRT